MRPLLVVVLVGCGSHYNGVGSGQDCDPLTPDCPAGEYCSPIDMKCHTDGSCAGEADCMPGQKCDGDSHTCVGGCGGEPLDLTYVPANMLLVLDRSCSMNNNVGNGITTSKWDAAVNSLKAVLGTYATAIRWGLTMFPDTTGDSCAQDAIPFPIADNNAGTISMTLDAALDDQDPIHPGKPCVTNIDTGIQQAATDPALNATDRKSYLMLISDGAQANCNMGGGDNGTEMAISDLHTMRGVDTFVVGFGGATDKNELNTLATLGGKAIPPVPPDNYLFYQADTPVQLDQAFQAIAGLVLTCNYVVDPPPADLNLTYVYFDNTQNVPRDTTHMDGWDFDSATQTLTFYGSYCTALQAKTVTDVDVIYGCASPPIL